MNILVKKKWKELNPVVEKTVAACFNGILKENKRKDRHTAGSKPDKPKNENVYCSVTV
jgi:hypothetical protein